MASRKIYDNRERFEPEERIGYPAPERHVPRPSFERRSTRIPEEIHSLRHRSRSPPSQRTPASVGPRADVHEEDIVQDRIPVTARPRSRERTHIPSHVRPNTYIPEETTYTSGRRTRIPPPQVHLTEEAHRPIHDTTHRTSTNAIIIEAAPRNRHARHRRSHRSSFIHEVPRPRTHETLVSVPEDHDVEEDFFGQGRGMWDFDKLLRESQADERRRGDRVAAMQQHDAPRRMRAQDEEAWRRFQLARDELDRMRHSMRRESSPAPRREHSRQYFASASRPGPSRWDSEEEGQSRKGKENEKEKEKGDGCCEKLLAFLQQDAEFQHYRWTEMRDWNALLLGELISLRRQAMAPSRQQTNIIFNNQHGGGQGADENTNTFLRPSMLGSARRRFGPGTERQIKVGFMFLRDGQAVQSKRLHKYLAVKGTTEQHDTWLIRHMTRFYAKHVATRRWFSCKKRLALAKFVRFEHIPRPVDEIQREHSKYEKGLGYKRVCTAQRWVLNCKDDNSYDRFEYIIDHPLPNEKTWMRKLENLVHATPPENDCIIWVYLFERVNYRFMLFLIAIFVLISTTGGVVYAIFEADVSGGLTISTYALGMLGVATAVWGAGEHLGVEKPDTYTYSFDMVYEADEISLDRTEGDDKVQ
ncbi:hypothetical protein DL765_003543 [Monosporascus sp. GIB2]|nr:hypothetical protein DL765_003543 [Monosporascus sp. GIB2]